MSALNTKCAICGGAAQSEPYGRSWSALCEQCGDYRITAEAAEEIAGFKDGQPAAISGWVKELQIKGADAPHITSSDYERPKEDVGSIRISEILALYAPKTVAEVLDRTLLNLGRLSQAPGGKVDLARRNISVCFARSAEQATFFLGALEDKGWTQGRGLPSIVAVTADGWIRIAELQESRVESKQVFVAMAFAPEVEDAYRDGFQLGITDVGLIPLRVDRKEHNEKICDLIIAEIRKSYLLIADFTLHRQGVYFEAGFAMGLGIPVVWTCRKDQLDHCHFDTRQYNHIDWEQPAELRERLKRRIEATVPHVLKKQ